jgi:hypothetical protein
MSSVGAEVGGKTAGGENVDQSQYPFFTSPGGVTPQQTALSQYDYGQNLTEGQAQFEGSDAGGGPSLSSMATQVAGGANMGKALTSAGMSDVNQGADYSAFGNAINIDQQNNENLLAENQQNLQNETSLAQLAGSAVGGQAGANAVPSTGTSQ